MQKLFKNPEVIFNKEISFDIVDKRINLYCEEIDGIKYTVANYDKYYYHLGNIAPNINAAVKFYQIYFGNVPTNLFEKK